MRKMIRSIVFVCIMLPATALAQSYGYLGKPLSVGGGFSMGALVLNPHLDVEYVNNRTAAFSFTISRLHLKSNAEYDFDDFYESGYYNDIDIDIRNRGTLFKFGYKIFSFNKGYVAPLGTYIQPSFGLAFLKGTVTPDLEKYTLPENLDYKKTKMHWGLNFGYQRVIFDMVVVDSQLFINLSGGGLRTLAYPYFRYNDPEELRNTEAARTHLNNSMVGVQLSFRYLTLGDN